MSDMTVDEALALARKYAEYVGPNMPSVSRTLAAEIERLRARNKRLEEALRRLITEVDNESPWRAWPDAKIRAFDVARIALEDQS